MKIIALIICIAGVLTGVWLMGFHDGREFEKNKHKDF